MTTMPEDRADASTSDERWAAWVARGVEHDKRTRTRAAAAVGIVVGVLALGLAVLSILG